METIQYGLNLVNEELILEKAKLKKNGIYRFRGVHYRVFNNRVTHYFSSGNFLERCFGFNVIIGKYDRCLSHDEIKKLLRGIK